MEFVFCTNRRLANSELNASRAQRRGRCSRCGRKTHRLFEPQVPLTNDYVDFGVCVECNPSLMDVSEVLEFCDRLKANDTNLARLHIIGKRIHVEERSISFHKLRYAGLDALVNALKKNDAVNEVIIDNDRRYIEGEGLARIVTALTNQRLKCLKVNSTRFNKVAFVELKRILQSGTLTTLSLRKCQLSDVGATVIARLLSINSSVEYLDLGSNYIESAAAAVELRNMLRFNRGLTVLRLGQNRLRGDGTLLLADGLRQNSYLEVFDLGSTAMGNIGASALATALSNNTTLKEVNLNENEIGNDGAIAVADTLQYRNSSITKLLLKGNNIGTSGFVAMGEMIKENRRIKHLDLCCNTEIGTDCDGIKALLKGVRANDCIEELKVPCRSEFVKMIAEITYFLKVNTRG